MDNLKKLVKPIAVFDAGIGSYAWARAIREKFPKQDIIYFADRANFPYAWKTKDELKACIKGAIERLAEMGASLVVVTSNAPSITVVSEIKDECSVPVVGSIPPIASGVAASKSGEIINLGVKILSSLPEFRFFVESISDGAQIHLVNAEDLVTTVESGQFITEPEKTAEQVKKFMDDVRSKYPNADVCTLSSTHLTWIVDIFQKVAPDMLFINPVDRTLKKIEPYTSEGSGMTLSYATASEEYPLIGLQLMFDKLGIPIKLVEVPAV